MIDFYLDSLVYLVQNALAEVFNSLIDGERAVEIQRALFQSVIRDEAPL